MAKDSKTEKKEKILTPIKRNKQNEKKREINKSYKSSVRTAVNAFDASLKSNDPAAIKESLNNVYSLMDKGVKKGIYKLNKASRTKARLTALAATKK
jgi:small subunit ribosomal protein S20